MTRHEVVTEVQPRLVIDRVDAAITFYAAVFGATLLERYVDASEVVVHAAIQIGSSVISLVEEVTKWQLLAATSMGGSPVLLHLTLPDPDAACERAVALGGTVLIPIADRPYGKREGRLRDPFGHLWILSCPIETLTKEQIRQRLA